METPELEQPAQRGPLAELGAEDVGGGIGLGGGEQRGEGVRVGGGVVVEQPDPVGAAGPVDLGEAEPHGLGITGPARSGVHRAEGGVQQCRALVTARGVDAHDPVDRAALGAQALDDRGQPAGTVMADEEGDDRGRHDR